MRRRSLLSVLAVLAAACGGAPTTVTAPVAPVTTVSVTAPSTTLIPQQTVQLAVVVKSADGATLTGRTISFVSSTPPTATVSASGLVTAVAVGTTTITATSEGQSGMIDLTVATGKLVGPSGGTVTGGNGAVVLTIPAGALAANTAISIVPVAGGATGAPTGVRFNGTAYQIGTPGLTFAQPVTITLKYDAATLPLWVMSGDMVLLGAGDAGWTSLSGIIVDTVAQTVSGTTTAIGRAGGGAPGSSLMRLARGGSSPLPSLAFGRGGFATALLSATAPPTVTIAVNPVTVTLTPTSDSVNTQKRSVLFHASLVPVGNPVSVPTPGVTSPKPLWRYRWRTAGQNGTLAGGTTDTGWLDSPDIQYICTNANLSVATGKMDDVILDVLLNPGTETDPAHQQIVRVQGSVFAGLSKTFEITPNNPTVGPGASQQLQFIVRNQAGAILPTDPNTRFTWTNSANFGDLQNGSTPNIVAYQAKSTFTSPPPRVDQVDGQIDGVSTVVERSTHWDFSNLLHPVLVVDRTQTVTHTLQGTTHTFVTVHVNYTVTLQPANPTVTVGVNQALSVVLTPAYNGPGLAYVWNAPGTHGTLSETNGNHSANKQATYTAKQSDLGGTDQITVKVVSYLAGVELETLGTGTANIVVDPPPAVWKFTSLAITYERSPLPPGTEGANYDFVADSIRFFRMQAGTSEGAIYLVTQPTSRTCTVYCGTDPLLEGLYLLEGAAITRATFATPPFIFIGRYDLAGAVSPAPVIKGTDILHTVTGNPIPGLPFCPIESFQRTGDATIGHISGLVARQCAQYSATDFVNQTIAADVAINGNLATGTITSTVIIALGDGGALSGTKTLRVTFSATRVTQ